MPYRCDAGGTRYIFEDLRTLLSRASPDRAGDRLAGLAAASSEERVAARIALADLPLASFLVDPLVPYETDEVTRLIFDTHDNSAFAPIAAMTAGAFRDFLLSDAATAETLASLAPGITPEMAAG
ncbi:MAG: ethanolamine ammonia-lyase subunit EutB, partial [Beijerinckiaceae bacterium]|nr:ethanolamine ammonia-lyase subunit EutB [Beijerinckiaceae bacterium]